jgi:diaminopimelate epimerase
MYASAQQTDSTMRFTKMHGAGNDYVYVDCREEPFPRDPAELARRISHRRFGVGGDGLILIGPSDAGDARMHMFNADGSEAEMCGNGIRCVAKYIYEHGSADQRQLVIETRAGLLGLDLDVVEGRVERVRVDMGEPRLAAKDVPTTLPGDPVVDAELTVGGRTFCVTCVSMGNPHCVTFLDQITDDWVLGVGPQIENDSHFPMRVNAEFVHVLSSTEVRQRTWERGSGETLACGTGASAVCVAGVLSGRTDRTIQVHVTGGDLEIHWDQADNHVYMTGPAVEVFTGDWPW